MSIRIFKHLPKKLHSAPLKVHMLLINAPCGTLNDHMCLEENSISVSGCDFNRQINFGYPCSGRSRCLGGSLYGARRELMIISAIIAVRNPDNCHPHLVRLHDRLWDMWCRNVPPDRQTPSITRHMSITISHVSHIIYFSLVLGTNPHHTFFFPACVSFPINTEPQHILSVRVFSPSASTVRVERSLL